MKEVRGEPSRGHDGHRSSKEKHLIEWHHDRRRCAWAVDGGEEVVVWERMGGWHRREGALQPRMAGCPKTTTTTITTTTMGATAADKRACTGDR
jgi:hypothetical protein